MNQTLKEAYTKITGKEPAETITNWQLAEYVIENFNYPKLGNELAQDLLFVVINHDIGFPDEETTKRIVGPAETLAEEMFPDLKEGHMADVAEQERIVIEKREQERLTGEQHEGKIS